LEEMENLRNLSEIKSNLELTGENSGTIQKSRRRVFLARGRASKMDPR
jgi:hypothetical protein